MRRFFRRVTFCLEEPAILPISQIHTLSIWHDLVSRREYLRQSLLFGDGVTRPVKPAGGPQQPRHIQKTIKRRREQKRLSKGDI